MRARAYALYGALVGVTMPLGGMALQAILIDASAGSVLLRLARAQSLPLMWVVDAAPLVLGTVGFLTGRREDAFQLFELSRHEQLRITAEELFAGAENLLSTVASFSAMTTQTANTVRATTTTMQQLSHTAGRTALNAETVVGLASASKKSSEDGLQEIRASVAEMGKLSEDVRGLASRIDTLNERMRSVFEVASVMNYLGDRFQRLADSAASEMSQGDSQGIPMGLRFIVAEMGRQGRDAKNGATLVQSMVNDMQKAMASALAAAKNGMLRAARGAQIASRTGENIKRMSSALLSSSEAAMQIAGIAKEQDSGIDEVLESMNQVYLAIEGAMASTQRVAEEAQGLKELAGRIDRSVRLDGSPAVPPPGTLLRLSGDQA